MKNLFLLAILLTVLAGNSQESFIIESPDPAGKANLDLLSISKSGADMEAIWLYRPVANVMGDGEESKHGKVYKTSPNACSGESHIIAGKTISECDPDKSIAYATNLYVIIKQKISAQGKNLGVSLTLPIALRYFKSGIKYTAEFSEILPFFKSQKIDIEYNISSLKQSPSLTDAEKELITKIFINQHIFVYNLSPITDSSDPYEQMLYDLTTLKELASFGPKIPENHAFKYSYEIGSKKFMLTKDKRYKNEKGSIYYILDITEEKHPVLVDSTFSADEGEFNEKVTVVDSKMKPCGMLFNYTIIKYLPNKEEEYSRQVIYVGADKKIMKAYFKTGHSRGGPLSSCEIKYAIMYNDTVFFESSSKRKKLPELSESFIFTPSGIKKSTPADTSKPFLKETMMNFGSGCEQSPFARGDNNLCAIANYRNNDLNVVFYQAKELLPPGAPAGTYNTPKNYGISSVSVFKNFNLISSARFYYPYNNSKPLRASFAYGNDKVKLFFLSFDNGLKIIQCINPLTGEIKLIEGHDPKSGFTYYQTLDKKYFSSLENSLFMVQKHPTTQKFRIIKID